MSELEVIVPQGMFGPDKDYFVDAILRAIAECHAEEGEWAEKYGIDIDNDIFMMHKFCWCDEDDCQWCSREEPNFRYKPTGFEVKWYKYIGRDMEMNRPISISECAEILSACVNLDNSTGRATNENT